MKYDAKALIALIFICSSCCSVKNDPVEIAAEYEDIPIETRILYPPKMDCPPPGMIATEGNVSYCNGAYGWINTRHGSITLENMWVGFGVSTDQDLYAQHSELTKIEAMGNAWICHSILQAENKVCQDASFECTHVQGELAVGGKLKAQGSRFEKDVYVHDNVISDNSIFEGELQTGASIVCFDQTTASIVYILKPKFDYDRQIIKLTNNSTITGDVHFASGNGIVIVDKTSCVRGGVFGGEVTFTIEYFTD